MARQLIGREKFTSIQEAQGGLTKLLKKAEKDNTFYRVLRNNKSVGVLMPNKTWEGFLEDLEALSSKSYLESIGKARKEKKKYSSAEIKKELGIR